MDIERQNFLNEVEAEIQKEIIEIQKEIMEKSLDQVAVKIKQSIDELFCECAKRYGTTLKKLADN